MHATSGEKVCEGVTGHLQGQRDSVDVFTWGDKWSHVEDQKYRYCCVVVNQGNKGQHVKDRAEGR